MDSYETILERMRAAYKEAAGVPAEDATDIGIRLKVLAGEVHSLQAYLAYIERQSFPQTATGEGLEHHAAQRGLQRRVAQAARGELTFSRGTALSYDVEIPEGVVCTTTGEEPLEYATEQACTLAAGTLNVTVPARAVQAGQKSNAAAGTVCVFSTVPTGVEAVTNNTAFTGGRNTESDDALRARLLAAYSVLPSGSNGEFYRRRALECAGVASACAVPRENGVGTVGVYVRGEEGAVTDAELQNVQQTLESLRELGVTVTVKRAVETAKSIYVYVQPAAGCTQAAAEAAAVEAMRRYFTTLQIGDPFLLIQVGQYLLNTGMIANYEFAISATDGAAVVGGVYVPGTLWAGEME